MIKWLLQKRCQINLATTIINSLLVVSTESYSRFLNALVSLKLLAVLLRSAQLEALLTHMSMLFLQTVRPCAQYVLLVVCLQLVQDTRV